MTASVPVFIDAYEEYGGKVVRVQVNFEITHDLLRLADKKALSDIVTNAFLGWLESQEGKTA